MRVLLVSTYELGHQPLGVATAASALRAAGHDVRVVDLAVDPWDPALVDEADGVAVSVPMHTAMRLADEVIATARRRAPGVPVCVFGLYAGQAAGVDRAIAGEFEAELVEWAADATSGTSAPLGRLPSVVPDRDGLPLLDRYARLLHDGEARPAAAVAASRGCASRCRHCPVPVVYDGRTRIVDQAAVVADVGQLVAAGVAHITFADPDFLNAVHHSMRTLRAVHERFPHLTFDVTTKVELILRHRGLWPELAELGCLFVVSALECVDDHVLGILDKGHTAADAAEAVAVVRAAGIDLRPSLLPFTPWTTLTSLVDLVDFVATNDLAPNVEPVHWTIRLLLPAGSLLLGRPELAPHLGDYDPAALSYRWTAADQRVDELQRELAALVEVAVDAEQTPVAVFRQVAAAIRRAAGLDPALAVDVVDDTCRPRLSESWFCCAEPTESQRVLLGPGPVRGGR